MISFKKGVRAMHWGDYGWEWMMGFGWFFMIIFWALVIIGVLYLTKIIFGSGKKGGTEEAPLDIIRKRYAKGEITKEEFERMKDDLMKE